MRILAIAISLLAGFAVPAWSQEVPVSRAAAYPDDVIVTGHVLPTADGRLVGEDIGAQTRQALTNLDALLKTRGSSLARAAAIHVALRRAGDFAAMNAAYAPFFADAPPTRTTIVAVPVLPGALVQVSAVALPPGAPREVVHPKGWPRSPNPYSYGIRSGDTLYLAGLVARRGADNAVVDGDVSAQSQVVLENAAALLAEAGMSLADIVSSRVYLTDAASFQDMNAAYRAAMPDPRPVRATVVCALMNPAFAVEMTFVAAKRPKQALTTPLPDGTPGTPGPNFSSAIKAGNRLYLSGFLGVSDRTKGDLGAQTRETLATIARTLKAAGASWLDVVEAVIYVTDAANAGRVEALLRETAGRDDLAVVTMGTGLVAPDGLVEVMVTARGPAAR